MVETTFLISKQVFRWFLLNYTDYAHNISHTKPSKYDWTSGTEISICLKKKLGDEAVDILSEQAPLKFIQRYLVKYL